MVGLKTKGRFFLLLSHPSQSKNQGFGKETDTTEVSLTSEAGKSSPHSLVTHTLTGI